MAQQDTLQRSKERYQDALDEMQETHQRILEDLEFGNPADPRQWPAEMLKARGPSRPAYTFDRTVQFRMQVVNDVRASKPGIKVFPVDSRADPLVAEQLAGMVRHIEHASRASIAYDTAIDLAAGPGLGWLRAVPQVMRAETGEQEIRILRVHDPLACLLEAGWTEPDGSDAMAGWATTMMTRRAFKARWPKASATADWDDGGGIWTQAQGDLVRVAEEFEVIETSENRLRIQLAALRPLMAAGWDLDALLGEDLRDHGDGTLSIPEKAYWDTLVKSTGYKPEVVNAFEGVERSVKWRHMTGAEILEETDFPSRHLPIVPVIGYETWVKGKRYICGLTRPLRAGQMMRNLEYTSYLESLAGQPKAPFAASQRAIAGHERHWERLNTGNPSFLPFNDIDDEGPIAPPIRLSPPTTPVAFSQGAVMADGAMEAAVGMHKAALGQQSNAISGRAKMADQRESNTATYHFADNLARSIEQLGRVVVDMIPRIYDTPRRARILGLDDEQSWIEIDPTMKEAVRRDGKKVVAINPSVGAYDVQAKAGPSFSTQRQEASQQLTEMIRGNPAMLAALGPMWARLQDWPEADKLARVLLAMAPPQVQALEQEEQGGGPQLPPEVQQRMQQMEQFIQQLQGQLQQQRGDVEKAQIAAAAQIEVARINAAGRLDAEEVKGWIELMAARMQPPPQLTAAALNTEGPHAGPSSFPPAGSEAPGDQVNSFPTPDGQDGQQFMG